jgi:hypothetical protein
MKTSSIKLLFISGLITLFLSACTNDYDKVHEETDGKKSLEGDADPANTGGKLGGSQSPAERIKARDTINRENKE